MWILTLMSGFTSELAEKTMECAWNEVKRTLYLHAVYLTFQDILLLLRHIRHQSHLVLRK